MTAQTTQTTQTTQTGSGSIRGREEGGLRVFRGVPFAAAPVGALRFCPPQPHAGWSGVRDAVEWGPIARQQEIEGMEDLFPQTTQAQSEDCLFLNVWTPGLDDAARPVMVWIHGGAFTIGSGSEPLYDGANLAARGDLVVVTINYRLGVFGFLNDPSLPQINLGIRDQIAALQWVRDNIANFGGDPGNVTIFGESSGAHSVTTLLAAPEAVGLFRRAIPQSPDPHYPHHVEGARRTAARLYAALGVAPGDLEALRARPAAELLAAYSALEGEWMATLAEGMVGSLMTCPILDDQVMPELPIEALRSGRAAGVDLLIGVTDEEFKLYSSLMFPSEAQDEASVVARLDREHGDGRRVYDVYRAAREARGEPSAPRDILDAAVTDGITVVHAWQLADAHAASGGRTFAYVFDWPSPLLDGALGACHAVDVPFPFGTQAQASEFVGAGPEVDALAECVMDAWIAFARTGDPSTESLPWPAYDPQTRAQMLLGPRRRVEYGWRAEEQAVWYEVCERLTAGGDSE